MLGNNIYDLTKFDIIGRDLYVNTPAVIQKDDKTSAFAFKTCEPSSEFTEAEWKETSLSATPYENSGLKSKYATAFWFEGGKAKYTFNNALIYPNKDKKIDGWSLTWTSNEVCSGNDKFTFTIDAVCDKS